MKVTEKIKACGIIPVVVIHEADQAVLAARALLEGGINVMEITFRTAAAKNAILAVSREVPEMIVGAGTVLNADQMEEALQSGAEFIVSPGSNRELLMAAKEKGVPFFPGVVTPSEIMMCLEFGFSVLKFFPSECFGGMQTIKALSGPFPGVKFIPTGGISLKNAEAYLKSDKIAAIGGSWMITADMISQGKFDEIRKKAQEAAALLKKIRKQGRI